MFDDLTAQDNINARAVMTGWIDSAAAEILRYNAATGSGVDSLTLASTGAMTSASLGAGNDSFTWNGGTISGALDGGADAVPAAPGTPAAARPGESSGSRGGTA